MAAYTTLLIIFSLSLIIILILRRVDKRPLSGLHGMKYLCIDNSWAECHTDKQNYYLAGLLGGYGKKDLKEAEIVRIQKGPYKKLVSSEYGNGTLYERTFVDVLCKRGLTHRVMFYEHGLIK